MLAVIGSVGTAIGDDRSRKLDHDSSSGTQLATPQVRRNSVLIEAAHDAVHGSGSDRAAGTNGSLPTKVPTNGVSDGDLP